MIARNSSLSFITTEFPVNIADLKHTERPLSSGGVVVVLNTGATIDSEAVAMLQALHSRSVGGIREHLKVLAAKGPEKFMRDFYVGYGHKSIGDCGTTTIFIEGVSMLAAKAIQDNRLYSGQEASTRYINFSNQPFIVPGRSVIDAEESKSLSPLVTDDEYEEMKRMQEELRAFYVHGFPIVVESLKVRFPNQEGSDEKIYLKAINARAFDIMRAFLPAGASTNLAWHTNLRQAADQLQRLRHHPLTEVREIALVTEEALRERYPSSFGHKKYEETEVYLDKWMGTSYYHNDFLCPDHVWLAHNGLDMGKLTEIHKRNGLINRPPKTELPREYASAGSLIFKFLLDFGSFRDIQRHRAVIQKMPILYAHLGFEEWYLSELPTELRQDATELLQKNFQINARLDSHMSDRCVNGGRHGDAITHTLQYVVPMGYRVACMVTGDVHALTYLVELRSGTAVHPTLRKRAKEMGAILEEILEPVGIEIHVDKSEHQFDVKRGTHDIVMKE